MTKLLILGASGLVGGISLQLALADTRIQSVVAPTRKPLSPHPKLRNPVALQLDSLLAEAATWDFDAVICALGTMMKDAGSKEAFRHVDYELPFAFAKIAHQRGAATFALTSSTGASVSSRFFYLRVKGELERDVEAIGFKSLLIVRPSLIEGTRGKRRMGEELLLPVFKVLGRVLPGVIRISSATRVASVLVQGVVEPSSGVRMVPSKDLS